MKYEGTFLQLSAQHPQLPAIFHRSYTIGGCVAYVEPTTGLSFCSLFVYFLPSARICGVPCASVCYTILRVTGMPQMFTVGTKQGKSTLWAFL